MIREARDLPPTKIAGYLIAFIVLINLAAVASGDPRMISLAWDVTVTLVLVLPVTGIAAALFLWGVYLSDRARPRSRVLWLLAAGSSLIVMASFITLYVGARVLGLVDREPLDPKSAGILIGTVIVVALLVVHLFAFCVWRAWTGRAR